MTREQLIDQIRRKQSFLCVGLDSDIEKIPQHLQSRSDPVFEFNKAIIDATHDLCVAFKMNTAFYEAHGIAGWESLQKTLEYIPEEIFTIADAKRGDIGNTSAMYARAFFDKKNSGFDFNAMTVNPYMGQDSVAPFFGHDNKWVILLALTSNKGSSDFQNGEMGRSSGKPLYELVLEKSKYWGTAGNTMYVVGATHPKIFHSVRTIIPDHFILVPGIGAQGGDLKSVCEAGMNADCGLLINASRNIIYASGREDFASSARVESLNLVNQMRPFLKDGRP